MITHHIIKITFILLLFLSTSSIQAEDLMMARTKQSFPEAMLKLQYTIKNLGYKISRVQRIDIGLTKSGYATDKYRIVFFGKKEEIDFISSKYPHVTPYIPWKVAIFAEQQDTLIVAVDPMQFSNKKHSGANKYLLTWKKDLKKIMTIFRSSE